MAGNHHSRYHDVEKVINNFGVKCGGKFELLKEGKMRKKEKF